MLFGEMAPPCCVLCTQLNAGVISIDLAARHVLDIGCPVPVASDLMRVSGSASCLKRP